VHDQQPLKNFSLIHVAHKHILWADGSELFRDPLFENVKGYLVHEILKLSYPNTEWLAMIHAMAVAYGKKAVVMPAPSGYGKSTLTAALLKEGLSYLGDDMVPIQRATHQITPLLTSLSIKKGSWHLLNTHYLELNELPFGSVACPAFRLIMVNWSRLFKKYRNYFSSTKPDKRETLSYPFL